MLIMALREHGFRKLGFIDYQAGDELQVHSSLLNIVLHD
jgi:hypothetical protein